MHRSRSVRRAKVIPDGKNLGQPCRCGALGRAGRSQRVDRGHVGGHVRLRDLLAHPRSRCRAHPSGRRHRGRRGLPGRHRRAQRTRGSLRSGGVSGHSVAGRARHRRLRVAGHPGRLGHRPGARVGGGATRRPDDLGLRFHLAQRVTRRRRTPPPTYKRGFGFNPLGAWCDNTKEPLGAMLRPGNAAPEDTDDHLELLEQVVRSVPPEYALGHEEGDDPALVVHPILVRADSAGATHRFVDSLSDANFEYSIGFPISGSVRDALLLAQEEDWVRATELGGGIRDGAEVIELTELIELKGWPSDMRVICRRERPHPGAQLSLFDTHAGWRHTCFITNTKGDDITALELRHRGHARVEDRVRCWKACGLANLPFDGFCANEAWVAVSLIAGALLAWSQMTCFDGALAKAEPKTMRYRVLHVAAVLATAGVTSSCDLDESWPWAGELATAFTRLRAAFP